jgi:hypothetical protein
LSPPVFISRYQDLSHGIFFCSVIHNYFVALNIHGNIICCLIFAGVLFAKNFVSFPGNDFINIVPKKTGDNYENIT